MTRLTLLLGLVCACSAPSPRPGTFVGNPTMSARIVDNDIQRVASGRLDALEVHVTGCEGTPVSLGMTVLEFDGANSTDRVPLPVGRHCGLFFVVDQFVVEFDDVGRSVTIVADDFDLGVPSEFVARQNDHVILEFGDEQWLADVAALAPAGETRLGAKVPALTQAFFAGLWAGSEVGNLQ